MLNGKYFYNKTMKKAVAVFGTIHNNIKIVRQGGSMERVPLSYGPKKKFLSRIEAEKVQADKRSIAIKLPRMAFEITSVTYDTSATLNRMNKRAFEISGETYKKNTIMQSVPYKLGIQLNILATNQDDALQIFEQILPYYTPEYTVAIKNMEGPDTSTDVPIVLTGVSFSDDYEGSFETRRTLVYTLDFEMRVRFSGTVTEGKVIRIVDTYYYSKILNDDSPTIKTSNPVGEENVRVAANNDGSPFDSLDSPLDITTTFGFDYASP
tara:strand:+ start:97 stop:894 length:798 start_codon:yes stop_codon:yes gene_type:complete